ncbi:Xaa-Pro aminopeptidase [Enterococcus florum]|uniref:Xaa-Pro aminopeptidase n=1 Tax=Enterococcus florum TaxID=2480627 RepID=A0A4V0WP47_9ENTE|nr:aminopeptidase P family protein [Enterococcus florum]GCF92599.1 Xaa-Pro aminopeptidase [Enterococcus florum]
MKTIKYTTVKEPKIFEAVTPVFLTDETMNSRKEKLLQQMKDLQFDSLVIYADREHGANFEYLTGFVPRFEEGLLILHRTGEASLVLGNENLKMGDHSRIEANLYHSPYFSLPNQPMAHERALREIFNEIGLNGAQKVGLIGWKMFTPNQCDGQALFDIPYFIVEELKQSAKQAKLINACHLFIGGSNGVRTTNNANEIAHYEYGANLASTRMLQAMNAVQPGVKESDLGECLNGEGQLNPVVTIAATGDRFEKANFYPTHKEIKTGDKLSLTVGYKGGLSSRSGFVIKEVEQLPDDQNDYLEKVVFPYYRGITAWLSEVKIGCSGEEIYQVIDDALPKSVYGWSLNPGHLVADEEWMSSPIYPGSKEEIKSGMLFQIDIIPSVKGYQGTSAEECVAIADQKLQHAIKEQYPDLWQRIVTRKRYIKEELNIDVSPDILPLSNTVGYLRPFFLAKDLALKIG